MTTIDEVPDMREETTRNRKGSAIIVLVHDRATDYNGTSRDPDYGQGEWYRIKDILDNAWGGKSREQGDVKEYWGEFFRNLKEEDIFSGSFNSPFAYGVTTADVARRLKSEAKSPVTPEIVLAEAGRSTSERGKSESIASGYTNPVSPTEM